MPLFIFVSGRFSKKEDYKIALFKIACLIETYLVFQLFNHVNVDIVECRPISLWFRFPATVSWYLLSLVYYRLLIIIIPEKILNKHEIIIPFLIVVSLISGFAPFSWDYSIQRTLVYMLFLYLGYRTKFVNYTDILNRVKQWPCIVLLVVFFLIFYITNFDISKISSCARNYYSITGFSYFETLSIRAGVLMSAVVISLCIMKLTSLIKSTFLSKIGRTTMLIYIYHIFFAKIYQHFNQLVDIPHDTIACFIYSVMTILIIMMISKMSLFTIILNPVSKAIQYLHHKK